MTTTSNQPVNIAVNALPLNSSLSLTAHTSDAPTSVTLHPSFEGTYVLNMGGSVLKGKGAVSVVVSDEVEDPSGEGRARVVNSVSFRDGMMGTVF